MGPLTDPTAHGGRAEDAFHLVLPSYPGYGFSGKPKDTGWGPDRVGRAWDELMGRLGYEHYLAQGGDWGAIVSEAMAVQAPAGLLGIHVNMPATVPPNVAGLLATGQPAPSEFSDAEKGRLRTARCLLHEGRRLCGDHEYPPANDRLRARRFACRTGCLSTTTSSPPGHIAAASPSDR